MTQETQDLAREIESVRTSRSRFTRLRRLSDGYSTTINLLTDLFGCILVGLALGLLLRSYFNASVLWVAGLTILGGIAGLWTVVRYALNQEKKGK